MKRSKAVARLERRRRAHEAHYGSGGSAEAKLPGSMKKPYPGGKRR